MGPATLRADDDRRRDLSHHDTGSLMRGLGRRRGFSIVDVLIVIVIVGILITIAYPRIKGRRAVAASGGTAARLAWVTRPDSAPHVGDSTRVVVRVEDAGGQPLSGVAVEFLTTAGSGAVTPGAATSDAAGVVPATWRFGADSGRVTLTARVRGQPQVTSDVSATVRGAH